MVYQEIYSNIISIAFIIIGIYILVKIFSWAKKYDEYNKKFIEYIRKEHPEIEIVKIRGSIMFVIIYENKYLLAPQKTYKLYKKDPNKFSEIVEAYLFEIMYVNKIIIETENGTKEIKKPFE